MKKLFSFIVLLVFILSLISPINNVYAQSLQEEDPIEDNSQSEELGDDNSVNIEIDEELLNGIEPFSIIEEDITNQTPNITALAASPTFTVKLSKQFGGLIGSWKYTDKSTITRVNVTLKLQYRESWLDSWKTQNSQLFSYSGGLGKTEENEKTWTSKKAGKFRACASGTITKTNGTAAVTGCSGQITHDGSIVIARQSKTNE